MMHCQFHIKNTITHTKKRGSETGDGLTQNRWYSSTYTMGGATLRISDVSVDNSGGFW